MRQPKVAIVCDWLTNMGGAERVVLAMHQAYPEAPIFTSVFEPSTMPAFKGLDIRTSFLQKLPAFIRRKHQLYAPLRALAFRKLDLQGYDIIISSSSAEAKAVKKRADALHICYCHTPTRYYWSHYREYLRNPGFGVLDPLVKLIAPPFIWWMRKLDKASVKGVDYFIANSTEVQKRIKKFYNRSSVVLNPGVQTSRLTPKKFIKKGNYYLVVGRQIPYKRIDLAITACNKLKKELVVIGNGSEHDKLAHLAGPTVKMLSGIDDKQIVDYFQRAKAFIFPAEEDFGIVPVEAMAAGTPVIAFARGGAQDYMTPKTGITFSRQSTSAITDAIRKFEVNKFKRPELIEHANQFSEAKFISELRALVKHFQKET